MLNLIWLIMILGGIAAAAFNGRIDLVTESLFSSANEAVNVCLGLIGLMTLWLGILEVAKQAGFIRFLGRLLRPIVARLFPDVPPDHPAMGSIIMNISANILGLGNAATPFGLKAMEELQKLNPHPDTATDAMCTFLAANTSCIVLVPATIVGIRVAAGSANPSEIVGPTMFVTGFTMFTILLLDYCWRNFFRDKYRRRRK
ncbi:MAG: nucleoside recognition domain-containing protein [Syntrophaceticus sp.]|nr:nucleoside recognition domain-containing protein [Syntrophaceticus sp.]MDD3315218.1 nucleoside recognition domain-containing protein [Syntrophaceticus sp.]MDD4360303.1 nucleoside recognition domain-containing protein [Syntrophaceticus sp.]MDD4783519.1 nucleoside recognition domain-containing protein [Syntrophaceticus sp.]